MEDDTKPAAAEPTRRRAASRAPGDTGDQAQKPAAAEPSPAEDTGVARFSMPDFRHKSADFAQRWFEANQGVRKRGVLTADGWYVPEDAFKTTAEK